MPDPNDASVSDCRTVTATARRSEGRGDGGSRQAVSQKEPRRPMEENHFYTSHRGQAKDIPIPIVMESEMSGRTQLLDARK